jgi:protein subunit release factor B
MSGSPVDPDRAGELSRRMAALNVRETDLEETFVRSGGHGGQNVNKTTTYVMLLHRPTGLQVKCQTTRHQGRNRLLARQLLLDKIHRLQQNRAEDERARTEKLRRQKRPRSHAAKQRMLEGKSRRADKKADRRRVLPD